MLVVDDETVYSQIKLAYLFNEVCYQNPPLYTFRSLRNLHISRVRRIRRIVYDVRPVQQQLPSFL